MQAAACGLWESGHGSGLNPAQVVIVGVRDIDGPEALLMQQAGVRKLSPDEATAETVLSIIGDKPVWIHVDWDALEPGNGPAAYAIANGLQPERLRAIFEAIPEAQIAGIELAELEASRDRSSDAAAIDCLLEIVWPLAGTRKA
ncbi:arginase family protein [Ensifer sp. MJa1]|uniref:arginase family protein n=1 Tax=Ensifer sp. MJa1 TaxID=2919888 RepID=UPI0030082331